MKISIPEAGNANLTVSGREVRLTNLDKLFWPERGITKGNLIQYYADVAPVLLPHIRDRAMVMKRYPHGAAGEFFFMKRAPVPRPDWIRICPIDHGSENVIDFPVIDDLPSLLWVINLGCIDLNQWYARCDDIEQPGLPPLRSGSRARARRGRTSSNAGRVIHDALETLEDAVIRQDDRLAGSPCLRADRQRA